MFREKMLVTLSVFLVVFFMLLTGSTCLGNDEIKIGLLGPQTGALAEYGVTLKRGADVAIDVINGEGGVLGKKLKLITRDDQFKPTVSVQMLEELIYRERVAAVVSAQSSGCSDACKPLCVKSNIPFILGIPTPEHSLEGAPSIFRIQITSALNMRKTITYGHKAYKGKKLGLYTVEGPAGDEAVRETDKICKEIGLPWALARSKYGAGEDLVAQALQLRDAGADFVEVYAAGGDVASFYRAAKKIGWDIAEKTMGSTTSAMSGVVEVTGQFQPDNVVAVLPAPGMYATDMPGVRRYLDAYKKKFGQLPYNIEDRGYDGVMLIAEGIKKAGSTDFNKVIAAIETFNEFKIGCNHFYFKPGDHQGLKLENIDIVYFTRNPDCHGYGKPGIGVYLSEKYLNKCLKK